MVRVDVMQIAFMACCLVSLIDVMGVAFVGPALVPYSSEKLGATTFEITVFQSIRFAFGIVSMMWMPPLGDKIGVKAIVTVSLLGSAVAYVVQATAYLWSTELRVPMFIVGRVIGGFFGGTQGVLTAFVTDISMPDFPLLKFRLTMLFACVNAGNFALAPIAGVIVQWGLHLPWVVCAGAAVATTLVVLMYIKEPDELRAINLRGVVEDDKKTDAASFDNDNPGAKDTQDTPSSSPCGDLALWFFMLSYVCTFITVSALVIAIPWLLEFKTYGLESPEGLASGTSLVMVPQGLTNLLMSTVGFMVISGKFGDMFCARFGNIFASVCLCLYGYGTTEYWQVMVLHAVGGVGVGLSVPPIGPIIQRYNSIAHADNMAVCSAFPLLGMQLGFVIGPLLFGVIVGEKEVLADGTFGERDRNRMNLAWLVAGLSLFVGLLFFEAGVCKAKSHPAWKRSELSDEEIRVALETNAEDPAAFVEEMGDLAKLMLTKGNPEYRNVYLASGLAQQHIRKIISGCIPMLPPYNPDDPKEHLTAIGEWLVRTGDPDAVANFTRSFPHLDVGHVAGHQGWQVSTTNMQGLKSRRRTRVEKDGLLVGQVLGQQQKPSERQAAGKAV